MIFGSDRTWFVADGVVTVEAYGNDRHTSRPRRLVVVGYSSFGWIPRLVGIQ